MGDKKVYFKNLDTLRFFAFFFVFTSHTFEKFAYPQDTIFNKLFFVFFTLNGQSGNLGVVFFFVLSGFLITYLIFKEKETTSTFSIKNFYIRRTLRIWPLYYLTVFFGFWLYPYIHHFFTGTSYVENAHIFNYIVFLGNMDILWNGNPQGVPLGVLWSLSVEEQFYLFWPVLFLLVILKKRSFSLSAFSILLVISLCFQFFNHESRRINYFHSFSCMGSLVIGAIVAWFGFYSKQFKSFLYKMPLALIIIIYTLGTLFIFLNLYVDNTYFFVLSRFLIALFFAFIIAEQNWSGHELKAGRFKYLSFLGTISYGLYMLHPIAIDVIDFLFPQKSFSYVWFFTKLILSMGFSILVAYISYNYFEKYFLLLKKRFEVKYKG